MKIKTIVALLLASFGLSAQVSVEIDRNLRMTFPGQPEAFDTLGQKVYNFSDEKGYYACIVQKTSMDPEKLSVIDINQFYSEIYQSLQNPAEQCQTISQQEVLIQGIRAMDFYTSCAENPEIPELRYKRLALDGYILYVIDFWTKKSFSQEATGLKNAFFESMNFNQNSFEAPIPSAFEPEEAGKTQGNYLYLVAVIGVLAALFIYLRKNLRKS